MKDVEKIRFSRTIVGPVLWTETVEIPKPAEVTAWQSNAKPGWT